MMSSWTSAATIPLVALLRPMAETRHQRFLKLQARLPWNGCIVESLSGKAGGSVPCTQADVAERRPKLNTFFPNGEPKDMQEMIEAIRAAFRLMDDGEISVSPYDTAWVALVKNLEGGDEPQLPLSIDWIVQNQLPDGTWGDDSFFLLQDRVINTLACIVALKSWNIHDGKCRKALSFIRENLRRLIDDEDWMPIGFEITLPTLLEMAKDLGLDLPYGDPALRVIYEKRDVKLANIPRDVLHAVPTTLLHSLEGMPCLDWKRLLELQSLDGSFAASPASTAYALMQTGDKKCLAFLHPIVDKFNGGGKVNPGYKEA